MQEESDRMKHVITGIDPVASPAKQLVGITTCQTIRGQLNLAIVTIRSPNQWAIAMLYCLIRTHKSCWKLKLMKHYHPGEEPSFHRKKRADVAHLAEV